MKTNEKLEKAIQKLGLTPQDVVDYFISKGMINVDVRMFKTPDIITPGMYEYTDGLIYPELIKGKIVRGIVGAVNDSEILVWCLRFAQCCWSPKQWMAGTTEEMNGIDATNMILAKAKELGEKAPAAEYCAKYNFDGVTKGDAFMPSNADYEKLNPHTEIVEEAAAELDLDMQYKSFTCLYWSSSEYNYSNGAEACFTTGCAFDYISKTKTLSVRPIRLVKR